MSWTVQDVKTGDRSAATEAAASKYEQAKAESLPAILKEDAARPFEPIRFQPVKSPGIYEAEFAQKDGNILFHFWPPGYSEAARNDSASPAFPKKFGATLTSVMNEVFKGRTNIYEDSDVGAFTVQATGYGEHQFWFDLAVKACKNLHLALGGQPG